MKYLCLLIFSICVSFDACSQLKKIDTTFLQTSVASSIKIYSGIVDNQNLYNGPRYDEPKRTNDLHPYFKSEDWIYGDVDYDGDHYQNIPLLYDIYHDRLVAEVKNGSMLELIYEKTSSFAFDGHYFVKIIVDTTTIGLPKSGFYEVLYGGDTKVIARREKNVQERLEDRREEVDYNPKNRFYVYKDGIYFPVKSRGSFLKVFSDEKSQIKQFMNKNKLTFKIDRGKVFADAARLYDTLKNRK